MPGATLLTISPESLDDLIYDARVGELDSLRATIDEVATKQSCAASKILVSAIDEDTDGSGSGCSLLHWPSANGNVEILKFLLSLFQSPSSVEGREKQNTALENRKELVNRKNRNGNTTLHWAALNGHLQCVQLLVEAGGDPTITNEAGHDAVFEAEVSGKDGAKEVAEWLLAHCEGLEKGAKGRGEEAEGEPEATLADETADVSLDP